MAYVFWFLLAVLVGALASSRGRSGVGHFLIAVVLSPLIGLVVVLVLPDLRRRAARENERRLNDEYRERERQREHEKQLEALGAIRGEPVMGSVVAQPSVTGEIERLAQLLERGLIDRAEFDAQKAVLLARR